MISTSTPLFSTSARTGRCEAAEAAAARLAGRELPRGQGVRVLRLRRRGPGHRPVWAGLRHPGPRPGHHRHRPRRQLPRPGAQAAHARPGRARRPRVRRPRLLPGRLRARHIRRNPPAGKPRDRPGRGDELRPQDPAQLLLEPVDQPRDPLPGRGLRVGLPLRGAGRPLGGVPWGFLDGVAPAPDGSRAERSARGARGGRARRARGRAGRLHRAAAAGRRGAHAADRLAAQLRQLPRRDGEPGPAAGADRG